MKKIVKLNLISDFIFSFTLIELLVVIVIVSILAGIGISGYMKSLIIERRQDAVVSMQAILIDINAALPTNPIPCITGGNLAGIDRSDTTRCVSSGSFYSIKYDEAGIHPIPQAIIDDQNSILTNTEKIILQADALGRQQEDIEPSTDPESNDYKDCTKIYLSDYNKIYPTYCGN